MNTVLQPSKEMAQLALDLMTDAHEDGGGTRFRSTGKVCDYTDGYYVGGQERGIKLPLGAKLALQVLYTARWLQSLPTNVQLVGAWVDGDTIYLDAVTWVDGRKEAMRLARERGELAVWEISRNEEVRLEPEAPPTTVEPDEPRYYVRFDGRWIGEGSLYDADGLAIIRQFLTMVKARLVSSYDEPADDILGPLHYERWELNGGGYVTIGSPA